VANFGETYESGTHLSKNTDPLETLSYLSAKLCLGHAASQAEEGGVTALTREKISFRFQTDVVCDVVGESKPSSRFGILPIRPNDAEVETDRAVWIY
jgi:hypothetical protein